MKGLFGIAGLLLTLAVTGLLIKQQLATSKPGASLLKAEPDGAASAALASPKNQTQQYKQALEAAMQTPRAMPDDK